MSIPNGAAAEQVVDHKRNTFAFANRTSILVM